MKSLTYHFRMKTKLLSLVHQKSLTKNFFNRWTWKTFSLINIRVLNCVSKAWVIVLAKLEYPMLVFLSEKYFFVSHSNIFSPIITYSFLVQLSQGYFLGFHGTGKLWQEFNLLLSFKTHSLFLLTKHF